MRRWLVCAFGLVLALAACGGDDGKTGSDDDAIGGGQDTASPGDGVEPGDAATGDKLGSCSLVSGETLIECMIYCGESSYRAAAKAGCEGGADSWSDDPKCPTGAIGVCVVDALMCEQYCYQHLDQTIAETREICQSMCGGTWTVLEP